MEQPTQERRGGRRKGAGRKRMYRDYTICIKVSKEAYDNYLRIEKKSEFLDSFLKSLNFNDL